MSPPYRCPAIRSRVIEFLVVLLLTLPAISANPASAGDDVFRIQDYVPEYFRDTEWRVSGSLNLNGTDSSKENQVDIDCEDVNHSSDSNSDSQRLSLSSYYLFRYETIPSFMQLKLDSSVGLSHSSGLSTNDSWTQTRETSSEYESDSRSYLFNLSPSITAGHYVTSDLFLSVSAGGSTRYREDPKSRQDRSHDNERRDESGNVFRTLRDDYDVGYSDSKTHDLFLSFLPGWGRVYEGYHASTAMYVIDELYKHRLIAVEPSGSQMEELAEIIHQNRRSHAVDDRLSDIEAMQAISDFLVTEGILTRESSQADFLIQDVWRFFPPTSRRFGYRVMAGPGYTHTYTSRQDSRSSRSSSTDFTYHEYTPTNIDTVRTTTLASSYGKNTDERRSPHFLIGLDYHRPINHHWQADLHGTFTTYFSGDREWLSYDTSTRDGETKVNQTRAVTDVSGRRRVNLSGTVSYIPTSRTEVSLSGVFNHSQADYDIRRVETHPLVEENEERTTSTEKLWRGAITLTGTYRVSIPTRLSLMLAYDKNSASTGQDKSDQQSDRGDYSVKLVVSHYIR